MGSILQFFDFNQAISPSKLAADKRQAEGHEAPRNSLEYRNGTSPNYNVIHEDIPYSCQVKEHSPKMNYRSNDAPMKRLIEEEMSKRKNSKCNTSVVTRLMGMNDLPLKAKPTFYANKLKDEKRKSIPRSEATRLSSKHGASSFGSSSTFKPKHDFGPCNTKKESNQFTDSFKLTIPQPREHPQEELPQKFKKDFDAWQTSKVWEHSRTPVVDKCHQRTKVNQIVAQENLYREKMARYLESGTCTTDKKPTKFKSSVVKHQPKTIVEQQVIFSRERNINRQKQDRSSPTDIVILRPSVRWSEDVEGPWSPEILDKEANMQDFLEEVKERLECEILGKDRNSTTSQYFNAETSFDERPGDTNQFARHIAKQIRENVTRDLGTSLILPESTRLCRSECQVNGPEFPEFINRNTRKLLSKRLENVMLNETDVDVPLVHTSRLTMRQERVKSRSMHEFSKLEEKSGYWEDKRPLTESKVFDTKPTSPRNLVRTFSAPVSGTAFAKLLLEDQHVLTRAHIHRKHEASENSSPESRRKKKDGFNLKGTVSNLKQNFTLKGKLFGKKTFSVDEPASNESDSMDALVTVPSITAKLGNVQDNSTEVPPSPASVSSSSFDEFCRLGIPSPVSPLLGPFIAESCSVLSETRNLSHVEHGGFEEISIEDKSCNDEPVEVEGHAPAYIREILITSGLCEGEVLDEAFPMWDASKKPIPKWVFDQVEETYTQNDKFVEGRSLFGYGDANVSRKMFFDLTNEALLRVLQPKINSTFMKWLLSPNKKPSRKKLLDDSWWQIQVYINCNPNKSDIVAHDVMMDPWCSVLHEDLYVTGRKLELVILGDLIDELMSEMKKN